MKNIETKTRKIRQSYRVFTNEQKVKIINHVEGREENEKISDILKSYDLRPNVFYSWLKKMNITPERKRTEDFKRPIYPREKMNVKTVQRMNVPMNVKTNGKKLHTVTLSVEVGSIMELISFCNNIVRTPKVKHIVSVE